jgi:peptidyl-prolyl cis-trans isomerase SurA
MRIEANNSVQGTSRRRLSRRKSRAWVGVAILFLAACGGRLEARAFKRAAVPQDAAQIIDAPAQDFDVRTDAQNAQAEKSDNPGEPDKPEDTASHGAVLDRVIAVVNSQVILASDLTLELRLLHLVPINDRRDSTPPRALERLITRALVEQQILQEDPQGLEVAPRELEDSLTELRQNLPACKVQSCATEAGWKTHLDSLGLTPKEVSTYWANRMAILRFIEQRFRSGRRISQDEIEKYYRETLVPQYAKPEDVPPLAQLSPRIQEILLQEQVNSLLNDWLKSLKDQGGVEILDASLQTAETEPVTKPQAAKPVPVTPGPAAAPPTPPPAAPAPDPSKPVPPPPSTQPSAAPSALPTPQQPKGGRE